MGCAQNSTSEKLLHFLAQILGVVIRAGRSEHKQIIAGWEILLIPGLFSPYLTSEIGQQKSFPCWVMFKCLAVWSGTSTHSNVQYFSISSSPFTWVHVIPPAPCRLAPLPLSPEPLHVAVAPPPPGHESTRDRSWFWLLHCMLTAG